MSRAPSLRWSILTLVAAAGGASCKDGNADEIAELTARVEELSFAQGELTTLRARVEVLESELAIAQGDVGVIYAALHPLEDKVERSTALTEEWADGTVVVRANDQVLGPLLSYYDTSVAFIDYNRRVVLVPLGGSPTMPFVGELYFSGADCTGTPYVEHNSIAPWFMRAGVLDRNTGLVYEDAGVNDDAVVSVLSRKVWGHPLCVNLAAGTTAKGYVAKTRPLVAPGAVIEIIPRRVLDIH